MAMLYTTGLNTSRCCPQYKQCMQYKQYRSALLYSNPSKSAASHLVCHHVCVVQVQHAPRQRPVPVRHHSVVGIHVVGNVCSRVSSNRSNRSGWRKG